MVIVANRITPRVPVEQLKEEVRARFHPSSGSSPVSARSTTSLHASPTPLDPHHPQAYYRVAASQPTDGVRP